MSEEGFTPESTEIATPETDHLENQMGEASRHSHPILWEHSRKLERERDELRNEIEGWRNKFKCAIDMAAWAEIERDELATKLEDNKQSLEVAIADAQNLENAVEVIMAAPLPDILRLFRERGILATMTTAKEEAK